MRQLEIDSQTNLSHILTELKTSEEDGLELTAVPNETTVLDNPVHRLIIEKAAKEFKKEVVFPATPIENAPEVESDDLGFVEGEDIVAKAPIEEVHKMIQPSTVATAEVLAKKKKFVFPKILKNKFALIGVGILILIFVFGFGFYFLPSATIDLVVNSDNKDTQVTLTGDTTANSVDIKNKIVPMQAVSISKSGSDQLATTGKKTIGTYATGRVTITNSDSNNSKTFLAASTQLTTATSSATFSLANDVTIPQAPFGCISVPPCPSVGVNVTANQPGADGNLPANTLFKVNGQTNSVSAKNDADFTGGSSKQVSVASSYDRDALKKQIVDKLTADAETALKNQNSNSIIPGQGTTVDVVSETYDPSAVDATTNTLKATISIKLSTFSFDRNDLISVLVDSLAQSSNGFSVDKDASKITLQQTDSISVTSAKFIGKINAVLHPKINKDEVVRQSVGKSLNEVGAYLDSTGYFSRYRVTTFPGFFKIFNRMPFNKNKITINVTTS